MNSIELQRRIEEAKRRAHGNWSSTLVRLGVEHRILSKRNQPCPGCGGKDRFQFTDKYADGNYICRGCGPGDGFKLLELCLGWRFIEALKAVEDVIGTVTVWPKPARSEPSLVAMRKLAKGIWQEARPVEPGDAVEQYLGGRGLRMTEYPKVLRTHPALGFFVKEEGQKKSRLVRTYPAMIAAVQGRDGHAVTIHRTYLEEGKKARIADPKKLLNAGIEGAAVRLYEPTDVLALAEGIETALAVHLTTGKPVWAAVGAANLEKVWIPDTVRHICIYADNDASYTGQAAAYALARRLKSQEGKSGPREVAVYVPRHAGTDWADVLLERQRAAA